MRKRSFSPSLLLALGGLVTLASAMGIGRFVYTPILPFMLEPLRLSQPQAGLIASANFLGYLAGALAASKTSLPGSRRAWLLGALAASAATTAAMGLGTELAWFLLLRFLGGVASAFALVFGSALVLERLASSGRGALSALHFAGVGCGIVISSLLIAGLAAVGQGWRGLWLASGLLSVLAVFAAGRMIPPAPDPKPVESRRDAKSGGNSRMRALILAYGLFGFGYVITATFISTMVRSDPGLRPFEPWVWLAVGLAAAPSVALWAWLGRRVGNHIAFVVASLLQAAGVALSVLSAGAFGVLLAAVLLGGTFMGMTALGLMQARALSEGDPRRDLALMTAAFGLGQVIGPSFAGFAHDLTGSFLAPSLVASVLLLVAAGLGLKTRADRA